MSLRGGGADFVLGETVPRNFTLKVNGRPADLTGCSVSLVLVDVDGDTINTAGKVSIADPAAGLVTYTPGAELTLEGSPYKARWAVLDGQLNTHYFPNSETPDRWEVHPVT